MFVFYSILYTLAFALMSPLLLLRRNKYAAGFRQRLGRYPKFKSDERPVIWLHCVSVGETNAARPLVEEIKQGFPDHRLIVSTTTKTGQKLASEIFKGKADAVFYFPFDWKFSVRRALRTFKPSVVLLMETEIWPNFFRETCKSGARIAIINGRLSEKSIKRYSYVKKIMRRVMIYTDLALMQTNADAARIMSLGMRGNKVKVTGNLKFDQETVDADTALTDELRSRFDFAKNNRLIVAASTHSPEEKWIIKAFAALADRSDISPRLLIAPRHPERFDSVAKLIEESGFDFVRRSDSPSPKDQSAPVILLDSIGELRAVYPLSEIVFVGGSLIRHGGQSVLEPAAAGKAIVTGPFTHNFESVVEEFLAREAIIQLPEFSRESQIADLIFEVLFELLQNEKKRRSLGVNAAEVMEQNRGATARTIAYLKTLLNTSESTRTQYYKQRVN